MAEEESKRPLQPFWQSDLRPFWFPDATGFVMIAVVSLVAFSTVYRLRYPTDVLDRQLDTMLTILYGTAFVGMINYLWGSSKDASAKDSTISKIAMEPVAPIAPVAVVAPVAPVAPIAPLAPVEPKSTGG